MVSAEDFLAQQGGYCQAESVPFCYCIPGLLRRYPENLWKQNKTGSWFGIFFMTFHHIGNVIIPTDEVIFIRGVGQPPTRNISVFFDFIINWFKGNHFVFTHLLSPRGSPQWHPGSPFFFEMDPNSLRLMLKKRVARPWKGLPSNAAGALWLFALRIFHQITVPQRVFVKVGGEMQSYDLRIW